MRWLRFMLGVIGTACALVNVSPESTMSQPVLMTVETGTENDTLYMGARGKIGFVADEQGAQLAAVVFPLIFYFSNGNVIGPIKDGSEFFLTCPGFIVPEDSIVYCGAATDPDTLLFAFIDFGGGGC